MLNNELTATLARAKMESGIPYARIPANMLALWCFAYAAPEGRVAVMRAALASKVMQDNVLRILSIRKYLELKYAGNPPADAHKNAAHSLRRMRHEYNKQAVSTPLVSQRTHMLLTIASMGMFTSEQGYGITDQCDNLRSFLAFPTLLEQTSELITPHNVLAPSTTPFKLALVPLKQLVLLTEQVKPFSHIRLADNPDGLAKLEAAVHGCINNSTISHYSE